MADTDGNAAGLVATEPPKTEIKPTGKFLSAGKPQPVKSITPTPGDEDLLNNIAPDGQPVKRQTVGSGAADTAPKPTFTDADFTAYLETKGIKVESIEKLKEKIDYVAPVELTDEQKTTAAQAKEKKSFDVFVKGGGTPEQYVAIKKIAEADLSELSRNEAKAELKASGFSEQEAEGIIKDRYYEITEDELDQEEDESDKDFLKRKKEYGAKKLANRSLHTKTKAQQILADLTKAADLEDSDAAEEKALSSKIEEQFQKLPRKITLQIGKVNNTEIAPIEYDVSESDLKEVKDLLQNTAERNNFLYHKDGSLNLSNLTTVLTRNKMLESAVKKAYHEGGDRQVTEFRKTFPALSAGQLGVGGSSDTNKKGQKGKLVSYTKPQVSGPLQHTR